MKRRVRRQLAERKRRIERRLEAARNGQAPRRGGRPEFGGQNVRLEIADRTEAIPCGGIGAVQKLVDAVGLAEAIDAELGIISQPKPYRDSDHVLNLAYNVLCGGRVLDDIEIRRNDAVFLSAIGARSIPDPTTAGDFCRRFDAEANLRLTRIVNEKRVALWQAQPDSFRAEVARIDGDGSILSTTGECKEGMDVSYKFEWGYHPLLISLANTQEPLFIVNRSGNRPSHEGAPALFDEAIELCRRGGFEKVMLRGDTDFSSSTHLDRWDADGVQFVFGYDAQPSIVKRAEALPGREYSELQRRTEEILTGKPRAKQTRIKEKIVAEREFKNLRLVAEDVAEFEYAPARAKNSYRMIAVRKRIVEERGQRCLDEHHRYFFYITNNRELTAAQVVAEAMNRCNQENLIDQLKNGVRALHAPLNTLDANWAYMVITALAWTIKAWFALSLPISPRWRRKHEAERSLVLRMEFRTFLQQLMLVPAQILRTARQTVFRFLAWRPHLGLLFRLIGAT